MMQRIIVFVLTAVFCVSGMSAEDVDFRLYQRIEEELINTAPFENPFTETELLLEVKAPPGRPLGSTFAWRGFHDGDGKGGQTGSVWKFRILFDFPGVWRVKAGFFVPGTSERNGPSRQYIFRVSPKLFSPSERGHVYVDPLNPMRFKHADGTPWIPFVFQSSALLDRETDVAVEWVNEHKSHGIDALAVGFHTEANSSMNLPGRWHYLLKNGRRCKTWPGPNASQDGDGFDYTRFDVASWRHNEKIIDYAQRKKVKLSIWFGVSGLNPQYWSYGPKDYPDNKSLGPHQKLFILYFLARWATYTCWWHWTIDSEYEETGAGALDRVRAFASEMNAANPWKTLLTTHVGSNWSAGAAIEFDLATLQRRVVDSKLGVTACRKFVTRNSAYGKPVYNAEGVWELSDAARSRIATWAHFMAGGFSAVAHFGGAKGHIGSSWGCEWGRVNPRHKQDVETIGKMASFFNGAGGVDANRCSPRRELARVRRGGHIALCLAKEGEIYFIWADEGGEVSIDLSAVEGQFRVLRYRCTNLENPDLVGKVSGGGLRPLGECPTRGFGQDYLFVVKRMKD